MDSVTETIDPIAMVAQTRVGTVLRNKWHLDALLGVGGMAAVYAATHRNGTRAAIKVLHSGLSLEPGIRARFLKEGRVANLVGHAGAVRVLDDDVTDEGAVYLVMELLDGESLEARAARLGGRLPVAEVFGCTDQLLDVLASAHDKGIVHRDLKPENLFLTRDGNLKVLDFGIARLRELSTSSNATRTGSILGTPAYMAPEQARGRWEDVDARTDLWAVGATMFRLLTGQPVHVAETVNEALAFAITRAAPSLRSVEPTLAAPVAELVDRTLAFDRDARWTDARTMQHELRLAYESVHSGSPISSAARLWVPATVPDRTLPSAGPASAPPNGVADTEAPVANGISAAPLLQSIMRLPRRVVAGVAIVAVLGVVAFALAFGDRGRGTHAPEVGASNMQAAATLRAAPMEPAAAKPPRSDAGAGEKAFSPEDLPTEENAGAQPSGASRGARHPSAGPQNAGETPRRPPPRLANPYPTAATPAPAVATPAP